jgi:hypothetical protein
VTDVVPRGYIWGVQGGWLEHEIRSLPQVLACSISQDDIVVLVQSSADPVVVERAVAETLRRRGVDMPVRVFGGTRPMFAEPVPIRGGRAAVVGSVGGALVLAAGVWLAGVGSGLRNGPKSRGSLVTLAPPLAKGLFVVPPPPEEPLVNPPAQGGDGWKPFFSTPHRSVLKPKPPKDNHPSPEPAPTPPPPQPQPTPPPPAPPPQEEGLVQSLLNRTIKPLLAIDDGRHS